MVSGVVDQELRSSLFGSSSLILSIKSNIQFLYR